MKGYMNNFLVTLVLGFMLTPSIETFAAGIHEIAVFDGARRNRPIVTSPTQFDTHAAAVRHVESISSFFSPLNLSSVLAGQGFNPTTTYRYVPSDAPFLTYGNNLAERSDDIEALCISAVNGADNFRGFAPRSDDPFAFDCFCFSNPSGPCGFAVPVCPTFYNRPLGSSVCETGVNITIRSREVSPDKNAGGSMCTSPLRGNPINVATGNKYQQEVDIPPIGGSDLPLQFERHFNSELQLNAAIGVKWTHTYHRLVIPDNETTFVRREDGSGYGFVNTNSGWQPDRDIPVQLEELDSGWRYTNTDDSVEEYDLNGRLISITDRAGNTQTLSYDSQDRLEQVTDRFNQSLTFSYDDADRIAGITDANGEVYRYEYDDSDNLITVRYPDTTPADMSDNPTRTYHYEDPNYLNHLTGITDETGARFASWAYDDLGRAILSKHDETDERVDIVYNTDGTTTVTDVQGQNHTYTFENMFSALRTGNISGGACATCGGNAQTITYDANGFVASRIDFNGNVTNFTRDSRGLELTRTEAFGTPEQRTITTTWHPDFRLPTGIVEPNKTTTFTYDANGKLLSRTERDWL